MSSLNDPFILMNYDVQAQAQAFRMLSNTAYVLYLSPMQRQKDPGLLTRWIEYLYKCAETQKAYGVPGAQAAIDQLLLTHPDSHIYVGWMSHSIYEAMDVEGMSDEEIVAYDPASADEDELEWSDLSPTIEAIVLQATRQPVHFAGWSESLSAAGYHDPQTNTTLLPLFGQVLVLPLPPEYMGVK